MNDSLTEGAPHSGVGRTAMTSPSDVVPASEAPQFKSTPRAERRHEDGPDSLHREINERRARVENPELLRHLRGL